MNLSANYICDEVVANLKKAGKKIGVWIRAKDFIESEDFYEKMFKYDIDFICSDYPLRAMQARERFLVY